MTNNYNKIASGHADIKAEEANIARRLKEKEEAIDELQRDTEIDRDSARRNYEALAHTSVAYVGVAVSLSQPMDGGVKTRLMASLDTSLKETNDVIEKYKPTDKAILAWALTIRGTIVHLREEFEPALRDFESAQKANPDSGSAFFNGACSASRLGLKEKALRYIRRALELQPDRRAEAKAGTDLSIISDDI